MPPLVNTGTCGTFASSSSKVQGEFLHNFIVEPSKNPETLWFIEKHNSMAGPSIQLDGSKASISINAWKSIGPKSNGSIPRHKSPYLSRIIFSPAEISNIGRLISSWPNDATDVFQDAPGRNSAICSPIGSPVEGTA